MHSGGARAGGLGGGQGAAPGARGGPPHGTAAIPPEDFTDILFCCHVQAVRAPVGLAVVKVLQLVPEEDRRAALPGVLQTVANLLKSRQQGVRCVAKIRCHALSLQTPHGNAARRAAQLGVLQSMTA